jgi:hypothetical protein
MRAQLGMSCALAWEKHNAAHPMEIAVQAELKVMVPSLPSN